MFKYDYYNDFITKLINSDHPPLHVEIHPGLNCDQYNCKFCYGQKQSISREPLSTNEYQDLLGKLRDLSNFIEVSGIHSEPLTSPAIFSILTNIIRLNFQFGIHTKGFHLNHDLINILTDHQISNCYITFSINASTREKYREIHKCDGFNKVIENIRELYNKKQESSSPLRINCAYLLLEENSSSDEIKQFIELVSPICDFIKISAPQPANEFPNKTFVHEKIVQQIHAQLIESPSDKVIFLNQLSSSRDLKFKHCWSQRFNISIDCSGNIFPCPQVATQTYSHLKIGNIREGKITEFERRKELFITPVDDMRCSVCNHRDSQINQELNALFCKD